MRSGECDRGRCNLYCQEGGIVRHVHVNLSLDWRLREKRERAMVETKPGAER